MDTNMDGAAACVLLASASSLVRRLDEPTSGHKGSQPR